MVKIFLFLPVFAALLLSTTPGLAQTQSLSQDTNPRILETYSRTQETTPLTQGFFNVKDFGAKGDGLALDSKAINKAIDAATQKGGGTVYIPAGNYLSGSIRLKSNLHLLIDQGAVIIAAEVKPENDYDAEEPGSGNSYQDAGHSHWHNSLIWGEDLHDLSITGGGMIWGKGLSRSESHNGGSANKAIALIRCRNVTIRDISILHGGWFDILVTGVDNLTLDNIKMDTNRDGIDIDCCRNVRMSNCTINAPHDDAICLKSTYALGFARATENVTITNCQISGYDEGSLLDGTFRRTKNGPREPTPTGRIKFGTESNGGFKNITISNCVFDYCQGLVLESVDGAQLEDVSISNITMRDMVKEPIFIRLGSRMRGPAGTPIGTVRRISLSNIIIYNATSANTCTISGIPGHDIEDIRLNNISIHYRGVSKDSSAGKTEPTTGDNNGSANLANDMPESENKRPDPGMFGPCPVYGLYVRHVKNISLSDVSFSYSNPESRSPFEFNEVTGIYMSHVDAQREKGTGALILKNVSDLSLVNSLGLPDKKIRDKVSKTL